MPLIWRASATPCADDVLSTQPKPGRSRLSVTVSSWVTQGRRRSIIGDVYLVELFGRADNSWQKYRNTRDDVETK